MTTTDTLKQALEAMELAYGQMYMPDEARQRGGTAAYIKAAEYDIGVAAIASLRAAVEAPDAPELTDAKRYRWLRELWADHTLVSKWHGENLDAAIDQAMKEQSHG